MARLRNSRTVDERGFVFLPSLEEGAEDRVRVVEIVMDDVDEEAGIHKIGDYFPRSGVGVVDLGPLRPKFKSLVLKMDQIWLALRSEAVHLPCHEADGLHDGRLNDLLAGEDAPRHRVGPIGMGVSPQISSLIDNVVGDIAVPFNMREQKGE